MDDKLINSLAKLVDVLNQKGLISDKEYQYIFNHEEIHWALKQEDADIIDFTKKKKD